MSLKLKIHLNICYYIHIHSKHLCFDRILPLIFLTFRTFICSQVRHIFMHSIHTHEASTHCSFRIEKGLLNLLACWRNILVLVDLMILLRFCYDRIFWIFYVKNKCNLQTIQDVWMLVNWTIILYGFND